MNTTHRSIWNAALGAWVAVSEITRACGKRSGGTRLTAVAGGVLALGLLVAPGMGRAQNYGATGGGHSNIATGDINSPLQAGNGGIGINASLGAGGGGGGGDGVRITAPGAASVSAAVTGGNGGSGGGGGGGGAGVVWLGNGSLTTSAQISGGTGGTGGNTSSGGGGGGGVGVILQGAGQLVTSAGITGGNGGTSVILLKEANAGAGVLLVGAGSITTTATGVIAGGNGTRIGQGGAGVALLAGGTLVNAGTVQGGNGGGTVSGGVSGPTGGTGSGGAMGFVANTAQTGTGGVGVTGAGITLTNSGTIAGGTAAGVRANAITFTGGSNSLTLQTGSVLTGVIGINSGATASIVAGNTGLSFGSLVLGGNGTVDTNGNALTGSGVISGAGNLTKQGTGNLILTGANTYSGGTTISAGTLQIGNGGTTGTLGTGSVTNNGALNFNRSDTLTVANDILGTGNLAIAGGTVILSGNNSYVGATTVAGGGTLQVDNVSALGGTTAITNNGSLVFNALGVTTVTGNVAGTGSLTQAGTGTTVLNGASTYSGATDLSAGTLLALNSAAFSQSSAFTVNAPATLNLNNFDESIGSLAGGGSVTAGGGRLTTGSDNMSTTFSGVISGTGGGVTKTGAGTFTLSGVNTYTGATTVNAGTLSVNGSTSNSAVTVNNGGTLGGGGTIGSTTIATGGILAPGNSIGTLTVNGNLSFAAGSVYRVEVDAAGANDRINATGTATLNGGTVDVQASAGTYAANTQYTILNAAGGRTGNFAGVTSNLAFLTPTLGYDANNVFLMLARNDISFALVAVTPNQIATSTALQNANAGATGDMSTVQTALTGLSALQARAAYDAASGAGIVALRRAGAGFATSFGNQLQARLGAQANAASGFAGNSFNSRPLLLAANNHLSDLMAPVSDSAPQKFSLSGGASSLSSSPDAAGKGLWVRGYGGYGTTDSDGNALASRLRSSGLSAGFDTEVKSGLRVGVAATGGTSRLNTDNNESGKTRGTALAVYGSYANGPWNLSGSASLGWGKNHLDRNVVVGVLNRVASSDFDSNTLAAYGEASYAIAMNGWTLQPLAGLSLSRNKADGFTETGAGALNLQVAEQTINSSKAMLGAKASFEAGRVRIEPRVIWAHEFGDLNTPMTAQFQGAATASPFQVSGATLKRDTLILGLGANGSIVKGVDLFADVQAEHNSAQRNLALLIGLRSRW